MIYKNILIELMRAFYLKNSSWEIDFLVNDLFLPLGMEIVFFNETTPMMVDSDDIGNCVLIMNDSYPFEKVEKMVKRMKPIAFFHLSDETGARSDWLVLSKNVRYYFKQYNHRNYRRDLYPNIIQIPCAYAPTALAGIPSLNYIENILPISERTIDWSFIGTLKADRIEMTRQFGQEFPNGKCITGNNCWDAAKQVVSPKDMMDIYARSVFCPIGRGNVTLDCSRVYEAILCGAIPVIVAEDNEIDSTFWYDGHVPIFVRAQSWDAAIGRCKYLMDHTDDLQTIQQKNLVWWRRLILGFRERLI